MDILNLLRDGIYGVKAIFAIFIALAIALGIGGELFYGVFKRWGFFGGLAALCAGALNIFVWYVVVIDWNLLTSSTAIAIFTAIMLLSLIISYCGCGSRLAAIMQKQGEQ